jgi:hypothetical protein
MNEVPLGPVCQALGLSFAVWDCSEPEVLGNLFSLVWVRTGQLNDCRYL